MRAAVATLLLLPLLHGFHLSPRPSTFHASHRSCRRAGDLKCFGDEPLAAILSRSEFLRSVLPLAAFAASFRTGAALAVIGQPRLPPLTGPYKDIGVRYARVGGARVKIFYPAAAASGVEAPYCTDGRATSDGMAGLVGFRQLGLSFLLAHLATARSGCWLDAAPLQPAQPLPLLCYSHGFGGNMDMGSHLMRQFASHGAVVAAIEHTDGTASHTTLEDGSELRFSPTTLSRETQLRRRADELLAAAAPGALGSAGLLPPLDAERTYLGGHSYGGPSALLASALPAAASVGIAGLLLHDPALGMNAGIDAAVRGGGGGGGGGGRKAAALPILSYVSDEYDAAGVRCGTTLHTIGGFHGNSAWSKWLFGRGHAWPPRSHQAASEGFGLPSALVRRGPALQIPPRSRGSSATRRPS